MDRLKRVYNRMDGVTKVGIAVVLIYAMIYVIAYIAPMIYIAIYNLIH